MKDILEFYNSIKNIKYGWHDKHGKVHENLKDYRELYVLSDENTVLRDNHAVCWEMCEIQRHFFNKHNIENKTIFAYLQNSRNNACHTFSVFTLNNKWYWFEASWINKKGIHEFNSLEDILEYYRNNFEDFAKTEYNKEDLLFFEYDNIKTGMNTDEFYNHCLNSKAIKK